MNKNDIVEIDIVDMSKDGSGIGRYENMAIFVPYAVTGDRIRAKIVKVKSSYCYGIIDEILHYSENRCECDCDAFYRCGGCAYRHIKYEFECFLKEELVYNCIKRIGKVDLKPNAIIPAKSTLRYRNKAQYPVNIDGRVGFYSKHSHRIVQADDCLLQPESFTATANALGEWIRENDISIYNEETKTGIVRHLYLRNAKSTGGVLVAVVINADFLPCAENLIDKLQLALGEKLVGIVANINKKDTNVVLGNKNITIFGDGKICDSICNIPVTLSPSSFYQVNRDMAQILYQKAKEYACPAGKTVLDLYCGVGTIGLSMADVAKEVIGVEIVPEAVNDAVQNAGSAGIDNARFICADAKSAAESFKASGLKPDVVIVDPPRKGCEDELIEIISNDFKPERIVYVSCDPATLARDIALFNERGYTLCEYTPIDLFPRTAHVETVALMSKTGDFKF